MAEALINGQEKKDAPFFTTHSIYIKDSSFEAPHSPAVFQDDWKPKIDFDLQMASEIISEKDSVYEVILHMTVSAKLGESKAEKTAFLTEIKLAGIFTIRNLPEETVKEVLGTTCPALLFPYARETICNLVVRGGFPQLLLPPINFDAMYAEHLHQAANQQKPQKETVQ